VGIFNTAPIPLVGIDISTTSVKILELSRLDKKSNRYRVESYAVEPLPLNAVVDKNIADMEAVGDALVRAIKKAKPKTEWAAIAIAGSAVITKTIQMTAGLTSDEELVESVKMDAEQYIPYPMEEVSLDFQVLGPNEKNPEEEIDIMLAASKSEVIDNRMAVLEYASMKGKVVDIEIFAMENAFALLAENDPEITPSDIIALVDIGATTTTFTVLQSLKIAYTREQSFGGNQLTEEIQSRYGLSYEEAMLAKRQGGLPEDYETDVLDSFKESMAQEISRAMQFYYGSGTAGTIAHTVLSGGCASIAGVTELVANKIGGHVTVANPFASMSVSAKVNKKALTNDAPALMIACGLALRSFYQ